MERSSARELDLPILALGDPWHDSTYVVVDSKGFRHVEVERYTRAKYEDLNSLVAAWMLDCETVEAARVFLFEEGRFFAPLMRKLAGGAKIDFEAEVRRMIAEQHGSLNCEEILGTPGLVEGLVRVFERIARGDAAWEVMDHHFCHAANAFLSSSFDEALSFTLDGGGPHFARGRQIRVHGSVYRFDRTKPLSREPLHLVEGWSPGWAWVRMAKIFGFGMNDAGTVMAMAAFGKSTPELRKVVRSKRLWEIADNDLGPLRWTSLLLHRRKIDRLASDESVRFGLAHALQEETEERIRRFLASYIDEAKDGVDICLSGGTFLNCLAAGKIPRWFPKVGRIFIPPAPYDGGLSIGLAQIHLYERGVDPFARGDQRAPFATCPPHSLIDVRAACRAAGLASPERVTAGQIVEAIGRGSIIALFQGGSESGRRALGNRSILADPRDASKKEVLNHVIKKRQWFRPFAPMILHEEVAQWFHAPDGFESPYMSFAVPFRPGKGELVPAVRHEDGTARVQTVHRDLTPGTHRLLTEWHAHSGIPILLNTSFNDSEPIVETPQQAVATMLRSGIDGIYFADFGLFVPNPKSEKAGISF
jgi:carbamoyltransferase